MKPYAHSISLIVITLACACAGENAAPSTKLMGIYVNQTSTAIIFLGSGNDLVQELKDSLAGVEAEKTWYRVELPETLMPGYGVTKTFDLAKDIGIRLVSRTGRPNGSKFCYDTNDFYSTKGMSGPMEISGAGATKLNGIDNVNTITDDGTVGGISFSLKYGGPANLMCEKLAGAELYWDVGASFCAGSL
jgi:hypothetical protein